MSPRFLFDTPGVWELSFRPIASEVAKFSACVCVCVCVCSVCGWLSQWWLVFVPLGLMLLWVMGVGFENTCTVSRKWNVSRVTARLYGWLYKNLRLSPLGVEHGVVVMTVGCQSRRSKIESYGKPIFNFHFTKCQFRISGYIKFWDSSEGLQSQFTYRRNGILICFFQFWCYEICVENQREGGRKYCFADFCYLSLS